MDICIKNLPENKVENRINYILDEFSSMLNEYKVKLEKTKDITHPVYSENDSMRMLLNKMQDYKKGQDAPKEVHFTTIKPDETMPIKEFNDTSESGFSLEEALHPTEDLEEIMKAFDFFNE